MYGYEWTDEYGIFRLTIDAKLQKEIRPVFHEELDFFGMDAYWDYPRDTDAPLLWAEGIRRYVLNGVCVAEAQGGGFYTRPTIKRLTEERLKLRPIDTERLYQVNQALMLSLEQKAITFIQVQHERYQREGFAFVCAFSGGKDSLALLDLCARALAPEDFFVVFSNTGMELSDTLKAVQAAKARWPQLRFEEAKSHMEPLDAWDEFGPPASRLRWCCSVMKSVPTILKLRDLFGNRNIRAIIYDGIRAEESVRRSTYEEIVTGAKSVNQINCHPILKWNSAELFILLLAHGLLINNAYRYGLSRVGCMVCPMSSTWSEGIGHAVYASEVNPYVMKVEDFAIRAKSEKESKDYIESGGWKARVGGRGLLKGGERVFERIEDNCLTFTIRDIHQDWHEVLKILGNIVEQNENDIILKIGEKTLNIGGKSIEDKVVELSCYPYSLMDRFTISRLRGLASKIAYCIGCKTCMVKCPTGAFVINSNGNIIIRENRCIHCYKCVDELCKGCLVADNLKIQSGGSSTMKNLDPYRGFGFRQEWLSHFIDEGTDCFTKGVLGTIQYNALRAELRDANIIKAVKVDGANQFQITPLGEKICQIGAYNPLAWAIIWANMAYNNSAFRWYCLNVSIGQRFEKGDLVMLMGEVSSKRNRENAINSLTDTFKSSPIGSAIMQGMPINKGYIRVGWEMPHAVALLYALYLYAEHTGRRSFTFTQLIGERNQSEARGLSPSDIYGIDVKAFREQVQGLAITYPKHLRVSFVANLDNIVLENFSSLDILDLAKDS